VSSERTAKRMRRGFKLAGSPDPLRESRMVRREPKSRLWFARAKRLGLRLTRVWGTQAGEVTLFSTKAIES
jgi:hypothetical protein